MEEAVQNWMRISSLRPKFWVLSPFLLVPRILGVQIRILAHQLGSATSVTNSKSSLAFALFLKKLCYKFTRLFCHQIYWFLDIDFPKIRVGFFFLKTFLSFYGKSREILCFWLIIYFRHFCHVKKQVLTSLVIPYPTIFR